jgi:hypothetical protein
LPGFVVFEAPVIAVPLQLLVYEPKPPEIVLVQLTFSPIAGLAGEAEQETFRVETTFTAILTEPEFSGLAPRPPVALSWQ